MAKMEDASRRSTRIFRLSALVLVFTVWLGSVWLFFIQPIVGKMIFPKFGGEEAVSLTAITSFSIASCLGLLFAWLLSSFRKKRRAIGVILTAFVLLLIFFLNVLPFHLPFQGLSLLMCLVPFCAAMCLLFILQVILPFWFGQAATPAWVDPYFVLAFAHLGAMTSVISYPRLIEPWIPLRTQYTLWVIGFAVIGFLFLACTWLLRVSVSPTDGLVASLPVDHPTWLRRFRWSVLGGLPTVLLAHGPPLPDALDPLHLVIIFELTLVVAYVRLPRGKPSLLSWGVQILAVLACLPSLVAVAGALSGPEEKLIYVFLLLGVLAAALVPHRWTLAMQGVMCLTVAALSAAHGHAPASLIYMIHLTVIAVTSWGCYGEMLADRPGPDRLAEFLFFTGLAPSVVFSFVPMGVELLTPRVAYPGLVLLGFLARFLPGKNAPRNNGPTESARSDPVADEIQPVLDTSIRAAE
jgi:hypothetical protein